MKPGRLITAAALLTALTAAGWWWSRGDDAEPRWREAVVERGDVRAVVSATGTVEAVQTVEVGTQVSGIVAELRVDFNSRVKAGDLLARIDPTLLAADVDAAEARVASAEAAERRAQLDLSRVTALHAQAAATDQELEAARAAHAVEAADARSARVALGRARRNLAYADITAPIDGVVLRRDVDVGQTVNAGFSAPTLFVLVGDLSRVRVLASVDEADIGRVGTGQPAEVSVPTWPDEPFRGTIGERRLDAKLQDNVVTYPVVVEVENPDGKLLPGMTATIEIEVASAKGVLCAPNAALRFRPDAAPADGKGGAGAKQAGGGSNGAAGGTGGSPSGRRRGGGPKDGGTLHVAGPDGTLTERIVETGLRGATCTEVRGDAVTEGLEVVIGVEAAESGGTSPFAAKTQNGPRGGGF